MEAGIPARRVQLGKGHGLSLRDFSGRGECRADTPVRQVQSWKGPPALLISAHAIAAGATLVTHDKTFSQVENLRTVDWARRM